MAALASRQVLDRGEEARQRLAAIVESSDDAILSKDLNGTILSWNAGAERLFGYKPEEVIGKSVTILIPEDHQEEEPQILERIRRGDRIEHYETIRRRKDGTLIDISLTVSPVYDLTGRVVGASKIARDIGDRKRTEQVLTKRIEELAALYRFTDRLQRSKTPIDVFQAALDAIECALGCERASILLFDAQGVMRFVAWRGLSEGYRNAVEGHSPWSPETPDPYPIHIDDVAAADIPADLKERIASEHIAALAFVPLIASGALIGKFMVYHPERHAFTPSEIDLALTIARQLCFSLERLRADDARRKAEDAQRESEERLQLALTSGSMGAWEWDVASGSVVWSPSLERIHGLEPGTFGGTFEDFLRDVHPDDRGEVVAKIEEALRTRKEYGVVYRMLRPDGSVRWLEACGRVVVELGEARKLAGVCMDVTERRMAESQRELLVAELSHRVKNTLATVISIAQQSFQNNRSLEEARASFSARIRALAQTHGRLAEASWAGVSLRTMLADELAPYRGEDGGNVRFAGPPVMLGPKHALTLGMAIHELATNAAKYGALSAKSGIVEVAWDVQAETRRLHLRWSELGGPPVETPQSSGFGRLLLERALAADLRGDVRLDFGTSGLRCEIDVPLEAPVSYGVAGVSPRRQWRETSSV
jgi:PAS domain S-box-containing protein